MGVDCTKTLGSILEGGEYVAFRKEIHPENKVHLIFYRTIDTKTQQEYLVATDWTKLTFFQKIKYFFRTSDFSLRTINRVAEIALKERRGIGRVLRNRPEKRYFFSEGLRFLQEKIESANRPKWLHKLFSRTSSEIDMETIKRVFVQLTTPPGGKKKQKKYSPPVQIAKKTGTGFTVGPIGRGVENPGCLCYCNSTIKAIWRSPALRAVVSSSKTEVARTLMKVLQELDEPGSPLSHKKGTMKAFLDAFKKSKPQWGVWLNDINTQRDQQELLLSLLEEILPAAIQKEVAVKEVIFRDRVEEKPYQSLTKKSQGKEKEKVMRLIQRAYIPIFDSKEKPPESKGPMMIFQLKADALIQDIGEFFCSSVQENIDLESFINLPKNHFTEQEKKLLRDNVGENKAISSTPIFRNRVLVGDPPPCLLMYVARFASEYVKETQQARTWKNKSEVVAPFRLDVPVENPQKPSASYELKGIVCHGGSTLNGGHYYNYFPLPGSPCDKDGRPIYWMRHSDSYVSEQPIEWRSIALEVASNATLYMYDKLSD